MKMIAAVAACVGLAMGGCRGLSFTFTLGPMAQDLREATVIDEGAGVGAPKVAMIDVRGLIADAPRTGLLTSGTSPVDDFVSRLRIAEDDKNVRAVIVRINSPGGTVTGSDTMYRELRRFRETTGKPVIASLGEVAASGGYYLALGADEIVAQPTSITGSIGVIIPTINVAEGLRRIGIVSRSVKSGANKDLANPLEPIREEQYAVLQGLVDEYYARFRGLVVARRGGEAGASSGEDSGGCDTPPVRSLDMARVDELTDGRVMSGAEAVRAGLADREGSIREAFERAKSLANVPRAQLVKYHTDADARPRTAYAAEELSAHGAAGSGTEVNLLRLDLSGTTMGGLSGGNAYYVWLTP